MKTLGRRDQYIDKFYISNIVKFLTNNNFILFREATNIYTFQRMLLVSDPMREKRKLLKRKLWN